MSIVKSETLNIKKNRDIFMKIRKTPILLALVFSSMIMQTRAALSPDADAQMRNDAEEKVEIKVVKVSTNFKPMQHYKEITVRATAVVNKVFRTRSDLAETQTILIKYRVKEFYQPLYGPAEPDIVRSGRSYMAYMAKIDDRHYGPDAGGESFLPINIYLKYHQNEDKNN